MYPQLGYGLLFKEKKIHVLIGLENAQCPTLSRRIQNIEKKNLFYYNKISISTLILPLKLEYKCQSCPACYTKLKNSFQIRFY